VTEEARIEREAGKPGPQHRVGALGLVVLMVLLSLAMWIVVPVVWLWIGSQLTESQQAQGGPYFVVGVGILVSIIAIGFVLARLNYAYIRLMRSAADSGRVHATWLRSARTSQEGYARGILDVILMGSALIAVLAMAVWFFFFAGSPRA
jgi:hypothetical protein